MNLNVVLSRSTGILSLILGVMVLLGWYLNEPALIQVNPAFVPMQYNTALGFALAGLALLGLAWSKPRLAKVAGSVTLVIGVLTLIEYIFAIDLKVDQLFMEHYIDNSSSNPGRMAPNTALCFSLTGIAVLLTSLYHDRKTMSSWCAIFGAVIVSLGIAALAGYMIGVEGAYGWGHMIRMAIHTSAGFIFLGIGLISYSWGMSQSLFPEKALPAWLPQVIGITGLTTTFALWQSVYAKEQRMINEMGEAVANFSDESLLLFGLLLTLALVFKVRVATKTDGKESKKEQIYAPWIVILLGLLLAVSLYNYLAATFTASVNQRFDSAVQNHTEAIAYGIETELETLFHIRSSFEASPFKGPDEFRSLVKRSLDFNPGIATLVWVPKVLADERPAFEASMQQDFLPDSSIIDGTVRTGLVIAPPRDVYYPFYFAEPMAEFSDIIGLDMAARPDRLATLMKAARQDQPAVSSRIENFRQKTANYAVFIALPVYKQGLVLNDAEERLDALIGFALMVIDTGPMIESILDKNTSPAGITMDFSSMNSGGEPEFMYRHVSRASDPASLAGHQKDLKSDMALTESLMFADSHWQVTAYSADRKLYPAWDPQNLWLPFAILFSAFGLAYFFFKQKLAEAEIKASAQRFQILFENASDAHIIFDENGILDCNNATVKMLRFNNKQELLARTPSEFSPEFQPDGSRSSDISAQMDTIARREGFHNFEWMHTRKDGEVFPVDVSITPVRLDGEIKMLGVWHDLTARKEAEAEIKAEKTRADEANQAKSAFLANMSHELRTPMNAILGYSEMLIEDAEDLEQDDFAADLKKINQAGNHLLSLINDVLDLSKVESGKMEAYPEDIDLNEMIDEVSATTLPLFEKNNNTLVIDRGEALGVAHQDLTKLRQNLFNLLSNAAKFTHEGTITLHVSRAGKEGVDWLTLSVSDTGIGIAKDKIDHVFEEFAQADGSTTRDYGGTGLGLAISQRFCKLLGGDLSATSEVGKGSTFTMRIPAVFPGSTPQPGSVTPDSVTESFESVAVITDKSTARILVIDDDAEALEIIERFLHKDGFSVVKASSGEEGLRLAREIRPTAITLDVMMPDMNGWSVLRLLKADPELCGIPVIMLTMLDDRTRGYALGAVDYLTKPVDRELLHKTLSRYHSPDDDCPVLVVEDDAETREIIALTLRNAGWVVFEAANGQDALDMMPAVQPGLILLDLMMPVMDGFGFITALRAQPEWRHIPVIVNTAKDLSPADREKLSGRVEEVMEKNAYTMAQLLEHVRDAVARVDSDQNGRDAS